MELSVLYRHRFDATQLPSKLAIWKTLCKYFFQKFIPEQSSVLDLACGYGEFINNISASKKVAVDLNPDSPSFLNEEIEFHRCFANKLNPIPDASLDIAFTSNFLEHLPSKEILDEVFQELLRVLRPGGKLMVLGPNIKYLPGAYWDFYDHHLPLTHLSLAEGLSIAGFKVNKIIDRFLPYTTQTSIPKSPFFVWLYLKMPFAWRIMGKQFFVIAEKP